ncbi:MAG: hypothetical protein ACFFD2_03275 [Promethearchaeota archaeon]
MDKVRIVGGITAMLGGIIAEIMAFIMIVFVLVTSPQLAFYWYMVLIASIPAIIGPILGLIGKKWVPRLGGALAIVAGVILIIIAIIKIPYFGGYLIIIIPSFLPPWNTFIFASILLFIGGLILLLKGSN